MAMARIIERAAEREAEAPSPDLGALSLAHSRVTRGVRLAGLLYLRMTDEQAAREARATAARAQEAAEAIDPGFEAVEGHKLRVERIVDRVIREQHDDEDDRDRLSAEAHDRLDDEDLYGDVMTRPVGELVALLCRDMELEPDWNRLGEEAWAVAEKAAAPAGSPFAAALPASAFDAVAQRFATGPPSIP
jgi:hypothetical protein